MTDAQQRYLLNAVSRQGLGAGSISNRTALALDRLGLIRRYHDARGLGHWVVTDAGRARAAELSQ